jgi:acetylornithine/N-succinyldiaminopimelate aminotransferase
VTAVSRGLDREAVLPTYARADVTIVRGEGAHVWDDAGRAYLDFGTGIAVAGLGHRHPAVTAAAHAQLDRLWHASNLYWTEPMLRLASLLSERFGGAQAFFCNSGAEANEAALKVARKATARPRIVALDGGFHGRTMGALSATGQPSKWEGFGPLVPGFSFAKPNDVESLEAAVAPGGELAAIMLEPVLGEGGVLPLDDAFVAAAAEIARELGALLVLDEVQAGLGRTGTFFAYEQLGIEPDLVTLAKGLANGLPIGALLARDTAPAGLVAGDHGSTFGGNPVACAAGLAVLEVIREERLVENAAARGAELRAGLGRIAAEDDRIGDVRGPGLMVGAELVRSRDGREPDGDLADRVMAACADAGLLVLLCGREHQVVRWIPPLNVTAAEIAEAVEIFGENLASIPRS